MILTQRQENFLQFVKEQHGEQVRKYTGEPYWHHVVGVAEKVGKYAEHEPESMLVEISMGHDLYEDTDCTKDQLYDYLRHNGYSIGEAYTITEGVDDLSDKYTTEAYPKLNRAQRKERESARLGTIQPNCQTVKYADLIDNTGSIVKHDKGFAKKYLEEKIQILDKMRNGNIHLFIECCWTLKNALIELQ